MFKSILASELDAFVYEYRMKGNRGKTIMEHLRHLDWFLSKIEHKSKELPIEVYENWLESMVAVSDATKYNRASVVRRFIIYLNELGYRSRVPLLPRCNKNDYTPYIYSHEEIANIFKACDNYRDNYVTYDSRSFAFPVIIRLLYSTGMRIGEALSIKNKDVNFDSHTIKLNVTKNSHERICPINQSLENVLRQYLDYRGRLNCENINSPEGYFFVGINGHPTSNRSVHYRFYKIMKSLGIQDSINGGIPRIHDLRHTACVHAMKKLVDNGKDLYCHVGVLSAFLGHARTIDTEHYIRLTREMYPELIKQDAAATEAIHSVIKRSLIIKEDEEE